MKKIFEIIFVFIICLASFCAGWVMSLRYQKKALMEQASSVSLPEMEFLREISNSPDLAETSLTNLPPQIFSPLVSENPSDTLKVVEETQAEPSSEDKKSPEKTAASAKQKVEQPEEKEKSLLLDAEKKRKDKFDEFNRKAFDQIKGRQNVFMEKGKYSFLINVFSREKEAMQYVKKLRGQFPLWNFFLRPDKQNLRVYLGPFLTKERAG
ncbi:MAG: SPOR domain-containing protein, partial [Bdellovibrionales bacterium]|nr:SPOR domain-containing protein [Bdellovibrionales bacterium]